MAGDLKIKIAVDKSQAEREIAGLEKLTGGKQGRGVSGLGQGNGKAQAANVGQVNKELERLTRLADNSNKKLKELENNLRRVGQQKGIFAGMGGGAPAAEMKALERYERGQQRSLAHWKQISIDRQRAVDQARADQPEPGPRQGLFSRIGGMFSNVANNGVRGVMPEGQMGEFMGGMAGNVMGPLAVAGLGAAAALLVKKAYDAAAGEQKAFADFIPRQGLGGAGFKGDPAAYMGHLRDIARPLGYSGLEALQIQGAMSTGGSKGLGLKADTQTAMQFARVMGIDGGQAGTMLAAGQRTGAFKSGDAKRFAEQLAREIAITGLGPRANEVQEATLSLLNQQMETQGQSTPGAIMALQAAFNKTGIPGLQGAYGGNVISRLNQSISNPGSDSNEAMNQAIYRRLNPRMSYHEMLMAQEKGIAYPGYLGMMYKVMDEQGTPNESDEVIKAHTNGAISLTMGRAIRRAAAKQGQTPAQYLSGKRLGDLEKLVDQKGILGVEAGKATGLPGGQLRQGEAMVADLFARAGTPIVKAVGTVAEKAEKMYGQLLNIGQSTHNLAEHFMPAHLMPGHMASVPDGKGGFKQNWYEKHVINPQDKFMLNAWDWFTDQGKYNPANHRSRRQGGAPPTLPLVTDHAGMTAPRSAVKAYREELHIHHHIHEHGTVSHASHEAVKRTIHQVIEQHAQQQARLNPQSGRRGHY